MPIDGIKNNATTSSPSVVTGGVKKATNSPNGLTNARFAGDATLEQVAAGSVKMSKGAKGDAVKIIQQALLDLGFSMLPFPSPAGQLVGGVDGDFGAQTAKSLANFQRHAANFYRDVQATGTLDRATLQALDKIAPSPGAKAWDPGETPSAPSPIWAEDKLPLRIVVVKNEHRTFLFDKQDPTRVIGIFSNALGKDGATLPGLRVVKQKLNEAVAKAEGKRLWNSERAFGVRIIDLNKADGSRMGQELHGTYDYEHLGEDVSHGCARHPNEGILTMYDAVSPGDRVCIVDSCKDPRLGAPGAKATFNIA